MNFAILRAQKLKSSVAVHRSMKHAFRAQETPNADKDRTPDNTHIGAHSVAEGMAAFRSLLPEKVRKNGVLCVEYLMTASPEVMEKMPRSEQDNYFHDALNWLRDRHGAENVVYAGIHRDEKTPHMYAYVVPKDPDTGRLNCRRFLGGASALREMQTDFAEKVGQKYGLDRGIEGSKAKHQRVSQFYGQIERQGKIPTISEQEIKPQKVQGETLRERLFGAKETDLGVVLRLNKKIESAVQPFVENASVAHQERLRAIQMRLTAESLEKKLNAAKPLLEVFEGLSREETTSLIDQINKVKAEKAAKIEAANKQKAVSLEAERRVNLLPDLVNRAVGSVKIFAVKALTAIQKAGGNWQNVLWGDVEQDATKEAVIQNGLTMRGAIKAILTYSPQHADKSPEFVQAALKDIDKKYPDEVHLAKREDLENEVAMKKSRSRERGYSR